MIDAYVWRSPNAFKVMIALEELGLEHELHWIDLTKGMQLSPEYLAINPNNKVPAIVDRDGPGGKPLTVFESGAILTYLADKTGKLLAKSGPERYITLEWLFFNTGGPAPMLGQLMYYLKTNKEREPAPTERFSKEADRLFKVLDKRLGEVPYIAGEYSIADIMNFTTLQVARTFLGLDLSGHKNLTRWLDELAQRPAFAKVFATQPPA